MKYNTYLPVFLALFLILIISTASAAPNWQAVANGKVGNTDELGFVRDASGTLHMIWQVDEGSTDGLRYRSLSADGKTLSSIITALTAWAGVSNPDLRIKTDGNLQALFGGLGSPNPANSGSLFGLNGGSNGSTWTLNSTPFSNSKNVSATDVVSVAKETADLYSSWSGGSISFHKGENNSAANEFLANQSGCCGYYPNYAVDSMSNQVYLGWGSNATGMYGQFVQRVSPNNNTATFVPESARADGLAALDIDQRMPISGRTDNDGVYVAYCSGYPSCDGIKLWRFGNASAQTVSTSKSKAVNARHVNIAKAPEGRFWVFWILGDKAFATRSNKALTKFGPIRSYKLPGDGTCFRIAGEGSLGPIDLIAVVGLAGVNHYVLRVLPPLTLKARPKKPRRGRKVKFTVKDAGDPVQGAKVKAFGRTARTNAAGKATINVPSGARRTRATATKTDYKKAKLKVKTR